MIHTLFRRPAYWPPITPLHFPWLPRIRGFWCGLVGKTSWSANDSYLHPPEAA